MPNETTINRATAPDSTPVLTRRKLSSDSIDVSNLSFFDELLSISQFVSNIPESNTLPVSLPDSTSGEGDDTSSDDPEEIEEGIDSNTPVAQPPWVAQSLSKSAISDAKKNEAEPVDALQGVDAFPGVDPNQGPAQPKPIEQREKRTSSETSKDFKIVESGKERVEDAIISEQQKTPVAAAQTEVTLATDQDSQPTRQIEQTNEDDGKIPLALSNDAAKTKPILNGRASSNASDEGTDPSKTGQDISWLTPVGNDGTEVPVGPVLTRNELETTNVQAEPSDDPDELAVGGAQPRNRRSERLSERASGNDSSSDERDPSSESPQEIDSIATAASAKTADDESLLSATTLSTPLPPLPAIAPSFTATLPISNTYTNDLPSVGSNARSTLDGVSAVTTSATRGGTQTSTTVAAISGSTPTSSRSESGRGETVRSNSGTQITAYQEGKLVQRVLRGVEQLANGGGQVRLRLHPAELGSLQISLRVEAGLVSAKLEVENATARDALLSNVQTLKDRLAEQGIKVGSFEVEVSADSSGSGTSNSNLTSDGRSSGQSYRDNATSRFAQRNNNRLPTDTAQPERTPPLWVRNTGSLDLTV